MFEKHLGIKTLLRMVNGNKEPQFLTRAIKVLCFLKTANFLLIVTSLFIISKNYYLFGTYFCQKT